MPWETVKIFGQDYDARIKFDNRTRNERFYDNTPADFKCDFGPRGLNLGTGQYGIVIDEIYNNKPIAPWELDIPIANNYYHTGEPPYGDSILSFQGLIWGTTARDRYGDGVSHSPAAYEYPWVWKNRTRLTNTTEYDDLIYSHHIASQEEWDIPVSDFRPKLSSFGRQLILDKLNAKQTLYNNPSLELFNTSPGSYLLHGIYNRGGATNRNDLGIWERWFKPNSKLRSNHSKKEGIYCRMFGNYINTGYEELSYLGGNGLVWDVHDSSLDSLMQMCIPIINCIATDTKKDWNTRRYDIAKPTTSYDARNPPTATGYIFPNRGNMNLVVDSLRPGLISMNERDVRQYCSLTGIPYGLIVPHPEDFVEMWKQIGLPAWHETTSDILHTNHSVQSGQGPVVTGQDNHLNRTFPFLLHGEMRKNEDDYTYEHLKAWYERDIINVMIKSLRTHGETFILTLESLFSMFKRIVNVRMLNKLRNVSEIQANDFDSASTFYIPDQTQLEIMGAFEQLPAMTANMISLLSSLSLLHFLCPLEQPERLSLNSRGDATQKNGALLTEQRFRALKEPTLTAVGDPPAYRTVYRTKKPSCCCMREFFLPFKSPDYFGVNREIKLQSNIITETFRGSFSEKIFGTWIITKDAYITYVTDGGIHLMPPEPVMFKYDSSLEADKKVIAITPETIDYIWFRFSNERDETFPFSPESTTTVTFRFVSDTDHVNTRGSSIAK